MTKIEAIEILKSILADLQRTAKDTDNVACCSKYGFISYGKAKECINALEQDSDIRNLPSVTLQEPKTGHCRDCKWWKDSDGAYRRGIGAESKCPINRKEVYEGNGYCFLFELQESEGKE